MGIQTIIPPFNKNKLQYAPQLSSLQTRRWATSHALSVLGTGKTAHSFILMESPFDLVRFGFVNDQGSSYVITKMIAAPSASLNAAGGYRAINVASALQSYTTVTFNGAGADHMPYADTGATQTLTVPALTGAGPLVYSWSDWMQISSIPDATGTLFGMNTRTYFAGAGVTDFFSGLNVDYNGSAAMNKGRLSYGYLSTGDWTDGSSIASASNDFGAPQFFQTYAREPSATVYGLGDSLFSGAGSGDVAAGRNAPWLHLACCDISRSGRKVSFCNGGWGGQTSANFYQRGLLEIPLIRPNVVVIQPYSNNDGTPTQTLANAHYGRMRAMCDYVRRYGGVPILWTQTPDAATTGTTEAFRVDINTRIRAAAATGQILMIDADAAVTDGASPARLLAGYATDSFHYNNAGHAAISAVAQPVLRRALNM